VSAHSQEVSVVNKITTAIDAGIWLTQLTVGLSVLIAMKLLISKK